MQRIYAARRAAVAALAMYRKIRRGQRQGRVFVSGGDRVTLQGDMTVVDEVSGRTYIRRNDDPHPADWERELLES